MDKRAKLVFIIIFSLFGAIALVISVISIFEPDDNYAMGTDTLVNSLREDTRNYKNVNRGHLQKYMGKTFILTGRLDSYNFQNNQLVFDSIKMFIYGNLDNKELTSKETETLKKVKKGFTARIKGKFDRVEGAIIIKDAKLLKVFDENTKLVLDNE